MEEAPLTSAHAHVRESAMQSTNTTPEQHKAAANDFAKAAEGTQDVEALRILKLLEEEHRRLAQLIGPRAERRRRHDTSLESSVYDGDIISASERRAPGRREETEGRSGFSTQAPPRQPSPTIERRPARPMSSSIASNLASARGIPATSYRQAKAQVSEDKATSRIDPEIDVPPRAGRAAATLAANLETLQDKSGQDDAPFQRFYSGFEGLWSKLSAPLAFAGLPLVPEAQEEAPTSRPDQPRRPIMELPDVNSIYSKAAMRAIRQDNGTIGNPQESFYVVPTGGGPALRGAMSPKRANEQGEDDDDTFEDAKESPHGLSPKASRQTDSSTKRGPSNKTQEELEMENESLKTLTDNLSKRLYMWEKNAQSQTAAMQQSIRSLHPSHSVSASRGLRGPDEQVAQLEDQLKALQRERDQQQRENSKLKGVVSRYRDRWDKLKEGARVRREGTERGPEEGAQHL